MNYSSPRRRELRQEESYECWSFEPEQIPAAWPELEPLVLRALVHSRGEMNAECVYAMLCRGMMYAFVTVRNNIIELLAVSEFVQYPLVKKVNVVLLAGRGVYAAEKFMRAFECWAFENGALEITGLVPEGRGHARLYRRLGFHTAYRVVIKDLRGQLS
jgi:hypothetical protein